MKLRDKTLVDIIRDTLKKEKIESRGAIVTFIRCYYRSFTRHVRGIYNTTQTEVIPGRLGTVIGVAEKNSIMLYFYPSNQQYTYCSFTIEVTEDKIRAKTYNEATSDKGNIQTIDRGYRRSFSDTLYNRRKGSNN